MNSRQPAYRKCNEVTLIADNGKFYTFWKNVHQQFLITEGQLNGLTFSVETPRVVNKEEGNKFYLKCVKEGYIKWQDFCKKKNRMCLYNDMGPILY